MSDSLTDMLPRGCSMIQLPKIADERGSLAFGEGLNHIPFDIKRIFWTYQIADGCSRGNHAHRTCSMVLFPMGGSFRIEVNDGVVKKDILMDDPSKGILIPPGVWCVLYAFSDNASCLSLASEPYSAEDYVHDYDEFLKIAGR